ncbi:hypothetical protein CW304_17855 [Bacillus sp. UFRGS-B20]|nr:hypothetical protein CW304_17855 [Bacillus sp. UFRGS-B20]
MIASRESIKFFQALFAMGFSTQCVPFFPIHQGSKTSAANWNIIVYIQRVLKFLQTHRTLFSRDTLFI